MCPLSFCVIDLIIVLFSDHFTIHDHDFTGTHDTDDQTTYNTALQLLAT